MLADKGAALAEPPPETVEDLLYWTDVVGLVQKRLLAIMMMVVEEYPRTMLHTCKIEAEPNTISYAVLRSKHTPEVFVGYAKCMVCQRSSKKTGFRQWLATDCPGLRSTIPSLPPAMGPMPVRGRIVVADHILHTSHKLWTYRGYISVTYADILCRRYSGTKC